MYLWIFSGYIVLEGKLAIFCYFAPTSLLQLELECRTWLLWIDDASPVALFFDLP
jgi:hypothetical protein